MTAPGSAVPAEFEFLSVVVPVRDEEASIDGLLHELDAALDDAAIEHLAHPKSPRLRWLDLSGCALLTMRTPRALGRSKLR